MPEAAGEAPDDLLYLVDGELRVTYASPPALRRCGKPADAVVGRRLTEIVPALAGSQALGLIQAAIASRAPADREIVLPDGRRALHLAVHPGTVETAILLRECPLHDGAAERSVGERCFRDLADAAPVMVWLSDAAGKRSWFNRAWLAFAGRSLVAERGHGWLDRVHPDDIERCQAARAGARRRDAAVQLEYRLRRADGAWRVIDERSGPRRAADGRLLGHVGSAVDVTESQRAAVELALSAETMRLAVDAAELGTWDLDLTSGELYMSARCRAMFGIASDAPCGMADFYEALHPEDRARVAETFARAVDPAIRSDYDVEYRTIGREDGAERWVATRGRAYFDAEGRGLRALGTTLDITESKRAEAALRASEARLRATFDVAPAGIGEIGRDGRVVRCNPRYHEITGYGPELIGMRVAEITHPADRDRDHDLHLRLMAEEIPNYRIEKRYVRKDGAIVWVDLHVSFVADAAGGPLALGILQDVTERKAVEAELQQLRETLERRVTERTAEIAAANRRLVAQIADRERAEEALRRAQRIEAVGQLTAGVAHDFNNLLTVVVGNLEMLATHHERDVRAARMIGAAQRAADRGARLTAQLLAFSRRQRLAPEPVDLNRLVANMESMLRSTLGAAIRIETELPPGLPAALADPNQIELTLLNLAINARDAMPNGGAITIATASVTLGEPERLEEPPAGEYVSLAVGDTGTGIAPHVLEHVFEPFFTTKEIGKGSGLGLPQVLGVAKQLGGGVRVETRRGAGTTVHVYLPRAARASTVAEPAERRAAGAAGPRRAVILLVDDDGDVRAVTSSILRAAGHEVIEAGSGGAALDHLARDGARVELMVADFAMPGMNGIEMAHEARRVLPTLPVLFVTGFADAPALAADAAADEVLQKPYRAAELLAKVAAAIERGRSPIVVALRRPAPEG